MCSDPACGRRGSRTVGTLCVASAWRGGGTSPRLSGSSASCPTVATPTAWAACARGGRTPRTSHQVSVRRSREGSPSERSGLVTILPPHHPHRACPQCRVHSSYIIPHKFWVSKGAEKEQLIRNFKARTSQIRCRFFMQGNGRCPFKSDCIYLHQQPDKALTSDPPWTESMQLTPGSEMALGPAGFLGRTEQENEVFFMNCALAMTFWGSELLLGPDTSYLGLL
ncbi:uncharacterized protein LOC121106109 isoform X2 [Ursus maritimus]|uniref:RING-type E3 ubiquitin transferase n=1 Tax=Ursus maritimus TaxID=29073 RepID=A0A8M1H528_URSMA|nr:uncharacterized protein LOC121106109 isoform X2 [Ursus maritimus]